MIISDRSMCPKGRFGHILYCFKSVSMYRYKVKLYRYIVYRDISMYRGSPKNQPQFSLMTMEQCWLVKPRVYNLVTKSKQAFR